MTPSIPYPGGKGRWAEEIVKCLPEGRQYIEPFAGRGNIFWALGSLFPGRYKKHHLNDIKRADFLHALGTHGNCVDVPTDLNAAYYHFWKQQPTPESLLLEPIISRDGSGYSTGGPAGNHHASIPKYQQSLRECYAISQRLKPRITNQDWKKLRLEQLGHDTVVVLDPPYYGADVRAYTSNGFDYKALVKLLVLAKFRWILMEYEQPFYNREFGKPFFRRTVGHGSSNKAGHKTECMWKNF